MQRRPEVAGPVGQHGQHQLADRHQQQAPARGRQREPLQRHQPEADRTAREALRDLVAGRLKAVEPMAPPAVRPVGEMP